MTLTQEIAAFISNTSYDRIPGQARRVARTAFADCVGTMIAGRNAAAPMILRNVLAPPDGAATICFSGDRSLAPEAAWINGTAAHELDYDDVAMQAHPSAVMVPAILAEAEALDATGADMIAAYVIGFETWAELAWRDSAFPHDKGWHPTGIFGPVAAAAACASLHRLDAGRAAHALGVAASQSGGLIANFGSMTKPFHAGRAAYAGLLAVRLAKQGFTASPNALEHHQGLLNAVSPAGVVDRETGAARLGKDWRILAEGVSIKRYPTCYCSHRAIDGLLAMLSEAPIAAAEVERIVVSVSAAHAAILRDGIPQTGNDAKFSMGFAMAAALINGRVGLAELADDFVRHPATQTLMRRVVLNTTTDYDPTMPGAAMYDRVEITFSSGVTRTGPAVRRARGHASLPLADTELYEKFRDCLAFGGMEADAPVFFDRVSMLDTITARDLTASSN